MHVQGGHAPPPPPTTGLLHWRAHASLVTFRAHVYTDLLVGQRVLGLGRVDRLHPDPPFPRPLRRIPLRGGLEEEQDKTTNSPEYVRTREVLGRGSEGYAAVVVAYPFTRATLAQHAVTPPR